MSSVLHGLPPIVGEAPRVLILGNMPSVMSLASSEYYGNPRNAFWRIMGSLYGFAPDAAYSERVSAVTSHGIAVWGCTALVPARREPGFGGGARQHGAQ